MASEKPSTAFRFRPGDRATVREHSAFRGHAVEVAGVDEARGLVYLRMHVWPAQPPVELELPVATADNLLDLESVVDPGVGRPEVGPVAAPDTAT